MRHLSKFFLLVVLMLVNQVKAEEIHVSHCRLRASDAYGSLFAGRGVLVIRDNFLNVNQILDEYGDDSTTHVPLPQNWKAQGSDRHLGSSADIEQFNGEKGLIAYGFEINEETHLLIITRTRDNDRNKIEKLSCHIEDPDSAIRLLTHRH